MTMMDQSVEETHKKGRQRKKQLYSSILQQMEFYFSDSNLAKDRFLGQLTSENEYVDLNVFLTFNKIRKLAGSIDDIVKALRKSELLELNEDKTKLKRKTPVKIKTNIDECTLYVQHIKPDSTHDSLKNVFMQFGTVVYVSIPKYRKNSSNKGFAFIEYDTEEEAKTALDYFEGIDCKISSAPEELCSITTFYEEEVAEIKKETVEVKEEEEGKKRKFSDCSEDAEFEETKRIKMEDTVEQNVEVKSKKKKANKKRLKELGLQVLAKKEWKAMRNRYLNMQRTKMKELKGHLMKKRLGNYRFDERKKHEQGTIKKEATSDEPSNGQKLQFVPNVIVKLKLSEPYSEPKKLKVEIKGLATNVQYVDTPVTLDNDEVFVRFSNSASALSFTQTFDKGSALLLEGDEEQEYWTRVQSTREIKLKKETKRQRGREKLLKKAERELGKHIRFDDDE